MRIQDAVMKLLLSQPFYGALAASISLQESQTIRRMKMTLFPDPVLKYNKEWYDSLTDAQAIGALLHELLHLMLLHVLRRGERDPLIWALCTDMAVNDHLPPDMLPSNAVTTEKIERELQHKLERQKSAERYYAEISRLIGDEFSLIQREGIAAVLCSNSSLLESDLQPEEDFSQMNEQALISKIRDVIDEARPGGGVPQALIGELDTVYEQPRIDWKTMFKRFLTGRGRMDARATYKRESRRYDSYPGSKRSIGLRVLIALDESGSISNDQLQTFFNELMAINRITNAQILVTEFDTECTKPLPAAEYRHVHTREKSGGTDFRPVFELADSLKLTQVVIFTDGDGPAPDQVSQKVLWVLTKGGKQPALYGYSATFE
jgi:predicted metal-dependent peptidase